MMLAETDTSSAKSAAAKETAAGHVDLLDGPVTVEVVDGASDLESLTADWDQLAAAAVVPNVFYESWQLRPALKAFAGSESIRLVCVFRKGRRQDSVPQLCGLFPLVRRPAHRLPVSAWTLWDHPYCYLRTPLVRQGQERDVLRAVLEWASQESDRPALLDWPMIDGDGPFAQALIDVLGEDHRVSQTVDRHTRALLRRSPHWEADIEALMSSHHRRELRRQSRRLAESGTVELKTLRDSSELSWWRDSFLWLESEGWKGETRTALAGSDASRRFFEETMTAAWQRGQLQCLGLFLNNEPIAMKVNLLSGPGSYSFKIAYDERYAKFSPGVQLELENLRVLHEETDLQWMDSCAVAGHFMINRLWKDRRTIEHLLISTGRLTGNLAVGAFPFLRAIKRSLPAR